MEAASAPRLHGLRLPKPRRVLAALSDEKLVAHVRRGDAAAFEVLYDRHSTGVLGFCRHMLGSVQDAEDAVQHSFIAAHADLQRRTDREIHFKAWLYTIARNRCLSMLRARHEQPEPDVEIVTDRLTDDVQQRADLRELLGDVRKLPEDQREALVLSEVGALSHTEVAEVIGCEVSKVKSLVFQARTALIDRRAARETPCEDIREQLATLRGGALRRSHLRHHLEACPGCTLYRDQIRRQRQMLALALPVLPSAGLRADVLGALGIGGGTAAIGGAGIGGAFGLAAKSGLAKVGVAALVAGGATGTAAVVQNGGVPGFPGSSSSAQHRGSSSAGSAPVSAGAASAGGANGAAGGGPAGPDKNGAAGDSKGGTRSASGTANGFTPVPGTSNGERAREFAATRGNGRKTGLTKTRHTPTRTRAHRKTSTAKPVHVKKTPSPGVRTVPDAAPSPTPQAPKAQAKPDPAPKSQAAPKTETAPAPAPTAPDASSGGSLGGLGTQGKRPAEKLTAG